MDAAQLRRALVQQLESLARSGVRHAPKRPQLSAAAQPPRKVGGSAGVSERASAQLPLEITDEDTSAMAAAARPGSQKDRQEALNLLQQTVAGCTRCRELAQARTQTVFGVGNPQARLCFFGEAPGADEDRQGEPFVGRAGQLLDKIIAACTLCREDVYILNVLKCRPPGNRNPAPDEVANCRGFFERQLEIIDPDFIVCLGSVAAQTLLETTQPIGKLRGRFHDYRGAQVVATYHPAYLLRNPGAKRQVWEDMQMLMQEMGIEIPQR